MSHIGVEQVTSQRARAKKESSNDEQRRAKATTTTTTTHQEVSNHIAFTAI
jgi:hypothetical protein